MKPLSLLTTLFAVVSQGSAQETFQYVGPGGQQVWETAGNWTGGSGAFSQWPGQSPEPGTVDSADLTGPYSGGLELVIASPGLELGVLTLGSTAGIAETVVSGEEGARLSVGEIHPRGGVFAINRVSVDLLLEQNLNVTNAFTQLVIDGRIINSTPSSRRDVVNDTDRTLSLDGDILLSNSGSPGSVRFRNDGPSDTIIRGAISDGPGAGGDVALVRGEFNLLGENTYTGTTTIGDNDPNTETTVVLHNDSPFGTGRLVIGGGNALKTIRTAFGKGTRTLENDIQLAREVVFAGSDSVVLNGDLWQSNGREFTNNVSITRTLTINGDVFASNSDDVREWVFNGLGTTIVNGVIDDSLTNPSLEGASFAKRGTGRVILTNPAVAAYSGATRLIEGVLQLGSSGDPVDLNDDEVSGGALLEIKHSGELDFSPTITDSVMLRHTGPGVTRLSRVSDTTGTVTVTDGVLVANGGVGVTSATGSGLVNVTGGVLAGDGRAGGVVTIGPGATLAPGDGVGTLGLGSLDLQAGSSFAIDILGAAPETDYDSAHVLTSAELAGDLLVTLDGFIPAGSDVFTILTASTLSGELANAGQGSRIDTTDGAGSFLVTYDITAGEVLLSDFLSAAGIPGDANSDGKVDILDLDILSANFGSSGGLAQGDFNGDGGVDILDLDILSANFGAMASASIPEPTAALLMLGFLGSRLRLR